MGSARTTLICTSVESSGRARPTTGDRLGRGRRSRRCAHRPACCRRWGSRPCGSAGAERRGSSTGRAWSARPRGPWRPRGSRRRELAPWSGGHSQSHGGSGSGVGDPHEGTPWASGDRTPLRVRRARARGSPRRHPATRVPGGFRDRLSRSTVRLSMSRLRVYLIHRVRVYPATPVPAKRLTTSDRTRSSGSQADSTGPYPDTRSLARVPEVCPHMGTAKPSEIIFWPRLTPYGSVEVPRWTSPRTLPYLS